MFRSAVSYTPTDLRRRFYSQARGVWSVTAIFTLLWVAIIVAPALLMLTASTSLSTSIYSFFGYICHQIPERSIGIGGHPLGVCTRCFGVYLGLFIGVVAYPLWRTLDDVDPIPRFWLFLSLIPVGIDWSLTAFGIWENTHLSRFVTGAILGAACATFIVPALVEVTRNISHRKAPEQSLQNQFNDK